MRTAPIWELSYNEVIELKNIVFDVRMKEVYNNVMFALFVVGFLTLLFNPVRNAWLIFFFSSALAGLILFGMMFFQQFRYHDYYMINMILIIPLVIIYLFKNLYSFEWSKKATLLIQLILIGIVLKNTINANASVSELVCLDRDPENCQGIDVFKYRIGVVPRQRLNMAMKALGLS